MENVIALHRRAVAGLRPVVGRVTPTDLDRPTPCAGWDLRTLLEHMTGQDHGFAAAVRAAREGGEADAAVFAPRPLGADPAAALTDGLDVVQAAFAGADDLDRPVYLAEFTRHNPLRIVAAMHLVDSLVHGWDVAAALGEAAGYVAGLDAEVVAAGLAVAERVPDDASREAPHAAFAHALPEPTEADPWTRTLTLLGRDPAWTAAAAAR